MSFICHIHNYTEYNQQWNVFSAFNPSKCTHTWSSGQPTQRRPGSSWGSCLAQGSHLSRAQFLPEPRFKPTTSDYKSNALSTRPITLRDSHYPSILLLRFAVPHRSQSQFHQRYRLFLGHGPAGCPFRKFVRRPAGPAVHICKVLQPGRPCLTGQSPFCLN